MWRPLHFATAKFHYFGRSSFNHAANRQTIFAPAGLSACYNSSKATLSFLWVWHKPQQRDFRPKLALAAFTSSPDLPRSPGDMGMDDRVEELVRQIHASPTRAVFYVAGGGLQVSLTLHTFSLGFVGKEGYQAAVTKAYELVELVFLLSAGLGGKTDRPWLCSLQALTWLLVVPGASNTVLESRVPYGGGKSMSEILGREPEKFASIQTAVDMARSAYRQAAHLSPFGMAILGVSCTCALATDRIKKGDHKVGLTVTANTTFRSGLEITCQLTYTASIQHYR